MLKPFRFVEITSITVRDTTGKAKHRIVLEHRTGAREAFESEGKSREQTIGCTWCVKCIACADGADLLLSFVELDVPGTKLYLDRSRTSRRVEQLPNARVDVLTSCSNEIKVPFTASGSESLVFLSRR